jgi:tRNA 2-thiouridine synthesizing protein E
MTMTTDHNTTWPFDQPKVSWSEEEARKRAREEGIGELSARHWRVIHQLRTFFEEYETSPSMHAACHKSELDPHCVEELFHDAREAWYISGLPEPGEEDKAYL